MLKVTVLKGDGSEELFYAKDMEAQGSVVTFYQSFEDNWRGGGYRTFDMKEEQHIKVERVD